MIDLPIPRAVRGWMTTLILSIVAYSFYYCFFYPKVNALYRSQFYPRTYSTSLPLNCKPISGLDCSLNLYIHTNIPKFILDSGPLWAYVTVDNESEYLLSDVIIHLNTSTSSPDKTFLLPKISSEVVNDQTLRVSRIFPQSQVIGRIQILAQDSTYLDNLDLEIGQLTVEGTVVEKLQNVSVQAMADTNQLRKDPMQAIQHGVIEFILLPPWSNAILLGLVLFSSYLAEENTKKRGKKEENPNLEIREENENKPSKLYFNMVIFFKCFGIALAIICIVVSYMALFILFGFVYLWIAAFMGLIVTVVYTLVIRKKIAYGDPTTPASEVKEQENIDAASQNLSPIPDEALTKLKWEKAKLAVSRVAKMPNDNGPAELKKPRGKMVIPQESKGLLGQASTKLSKRRKTLMLQESKTPFDEGITVLKKPIIMPVFTKESHPLFDQAPTELEKIKTKPANQQESSAPTDLKPIELEKTESEPDDPFLVNPLKGKEQ
jgi:hypothetical protein